MGSFATVKSGSRIINLHAFTGLIVDQQRSTVTEVTHRPGNAFGSTSHSSSYNKVFVRDESGEERSLEFADKGFSGRQGQKASIIWGIREGRTEGDYMAIVNHEMDSVQCIRKAINDNAGPPFYNMLLIVLVIVGCFGLTDVFGGHIGSALFFFAVSGGGIYWIYRKQKGLLAAVRSAALAMKV